MKISEKVSQLRSREDTKDSVLYSFEYFPPRTDKGLESLLERIDRMSLLNPLWIDVTWRAGKTSYLTLEMWQHLQMFSGIDVMMHLTCNNMTQAQLNEALNKCKEYGVRNILALRGDAPEEDEVAVNDWGMNYAIDLINYIKEQHEDYFCIGVAGYPETHLEASSPEDDIMHLKEKVDAGADLIITQLFFDNEIFINYVKRWRDAGISIPIIPGIMPIQSYEGFHKMTSLCQTKVPDEILSHLEEWKHDDAKVKKYGIDLGVQMCNQLIENGVKQIHYYTVNLEKSVVDIIRELGILRKQKELPWKKPSFKERVEETVRPIFWANKPKSYIARTNEWDEFPNGRWGVSRSPAFGDIGEYASMSKIYKKSKKQLKEMWGENFLSEKCIGDLIINYIWGKVKRLPWWEEMIQKETSLISAFLKELNSNYMFTINSQPRVNCSPSSDPIFGWGPSGGYIFQKEYIEFLIPECFARSLAEYLNKYPSISYQGINSEGREFSNVSKDSVNAVTWGIFPSQEVTQPTVVDHTAFYIWAEELFDSIKNDWLTIYEPESKSAKIVNRLYNNYYLINIVDNDFVNGDLEELMLKFISENIESIETYEETSVN